MQATPSLSAFIVHCRWLLLLLCLLLLLLLLLVVSLATAVAAGGAAVAIVTCPWCCLCCIPEQLARKGPQYCLFWSSELSSNTGVGGLELAPASEGERTLEDMEAVTMKGRLGTNEQGCGSKRTVTARAA